MESPRSSFVPRAAEWAMMHIMAGLLTIGDGLSGNIAEYYKKVAGKLGMSPKIKVFDDVQAQGGCNDDNGKGYPYLMNRVFIQHSLNLFFVGASRRARAPSQRRLAGVEAWVAVACIAVESRCVLLACMPPFLFDVGYWVAMDIPDIGGPPGAVQTYIVSTAVILATVALKDEYPNINDGEYFLGLALPVLFMLVAAARLVAGAAGIMPSVCDKVGSAAPLSTS